MGGVVVRFGLKYSLALSYLCCLNIVDRSAIGAQCAVHVAEILLNIEQCDSKFHRPFIAAVTPAHPKQLDIRKGLSLVSENPLPRSFIVGPLITCRARVFLATHFSALVLSSFYLCTCLNVPFGCENCKGPLAVGGSQQHTLGFDPHKFDRL